MRIVAKRSRCEGHGICVDQAPSLLMVGDDGVVRLIDSSDDLSQREAVLARAAVASCPVAALVLSAP